MKIFKFDEFINESWKSEYEQSVLDALDEMGPDQVEYLLDEDPGEIFDRLEDMLKRADDKYSKEVAKLIHKNDGKTSTEIQQLVMNFLNK